MVSILAEPEHITTEVELRNYLPVDESCVVEMLGPVLGNLYPAGGSWLTRRLRDVAGKRARCIVAVAEGTLVGVLIETPKSRNRVKISTLYVTESRRGHGIAGRLLDCAIGHLLLQKVDTAYITAAHSISSEIGRVLLSRDFNWKYRVCDRYGQGRHEDVFELKLAKRQ
jgi:predicted GNAT family acetyltransferase